MGNIYSADEANTVFIRDESLTAATYSFADVLTPNSLVIPEEGNLQLGDGFNISTKELRACIKVMRELARKEYPEDFI